MRALLVLLLIPAPAYSQAAMDMQQQLQAAQMRSSNPGGPAGAVERTPNPDAMMQDRLEALVMAGKCDEATTLAKSYRNKLLIGSVKQACEN